MVLLIEHYLATQCFTTDERTVPGRGGSDFRKRSKRDGRGRRGAGGGRVFLCLNGGSLNFS